jgi:hypothetical protein
LDVRIALVIGNAAYAAPAALANPVNDAAAMSAALRRLGFTVTELRDASQEQMTAAVAQVGAGMKGRQAVGLFYYAGHGLQQDWRNYLVPVNAELRSSADVVARTLDVDTVLTAFRTAGSRMNIVVLDACRDNPFAGTPGAKGLAQMDAPPGTFLAYATAPGNVAADGSGQNGLYTGFLVQELARPAAKIEDVFKRVRLQVRQQSHGRQVPWESTSLEDDFFFASAEALAQGAARSKEQDTREAMERAFAAEKTDWEALRETQSADGLFEFLKKYPSGMFAEQAQFRLDQLQKAQLVQAPRRDGVTALPSGSWRYRQGDVLVYDRIDGFTKARTRAQQRVTYADADRVEVNNGRIVWDQMGGVLRNPGGQKSNPIVLAPSDLALGKRWRTAATNEHEGKESTVFWEARVVALEDVTVPAGTYKAYRIERRGDTTSSNGGYTTRTSTVWIDPRTMILVKYEQMDRSGGKITHHGSQELVEARLVPR